MTKAEIKQWCTDNLFGQRKIYGVEIPLTRAQRAILQLAVAVILKWEARDEATKEVSSKVTPSAKKRVDLLADRVPSAGKEELPNFVQGPDIQDKSSR
jgi:hypothetical protein